MGVWWGWRRTVKWLCPTVATHPAPPFLSPRKQQVHLQFKAWGSRGGGSGKRGAALAAFGGKVLAASRFGAGGEVVASTGRLAAPPKN